jgi:hypothetical protein
MGADVMETLIIQQSKQGQHHFGTSPYADGVLGQW